MTHDIQGNEAHIWLIYLVSLHSERDHFRQPLDCEELGWAAQYKDPVQQTQAILQRGILRTILASYLRMDSPALCFQAGQYGKPALINADLQFNLSHAGPWLCIGINMDNPIGVDIEIETALTLPEIAAIQRSYFHPAEKAYCQKNMRRFYEVWTAKEAYCKMHGWGIAAHSLLEINTRAIEDEYLIRRFDQGRLFGAYITSQSKVETRFFDTDDLARLM